MNDPCVRFLHRALPRPRAGSDKLTTAGPGLALNSTCGIGHTLAIRLRLVRRDSTVIRVGRITTPLQPASVNYRTKYFHINDSFVILAALLPVTCFVRIVYQVHYTEFPAQYSSTTIFTELRDSISLL